MTGTAYIEAMNRRIPRESISTDSLPPLAQLEFYDWEQATFTGSTRGGVSPRISAVWLFCIFTAVLPANERIEFRNVTDPASRLTAEALEGMRAAGDEIAGILYDVRQATGDGDSPNEDAGESSPPPEETSNPTGGTPSSLSSELTPERGAIKSSGGRRALGTSKGS